MLVSFSSINKKKLWHQLFNTFEFYRTVALVTYKEWAAYRSHMAVSLFVGPVFFLVQYFIWNAVYHTQGSIRGFTLHQMITYYGISAVISYVTFDFADWNLQMLIQTGKFTTFLLRPVTHIYFALAQKLGHRLLSLWVEFLPICLIFYFVFGVKLIPPYPFWAGISILLSFLMAFLMNYCIGITAFWLTRTQGVRRAFQVLKDICAGVLIPLTFFPESFQKLLFFLPFQYITYVPTKVFIGNYELGGISLTVPQIVGVQALAVTVMIVFTGALWTLGLKKFTGVGT